jgi:type I restriction enzyme S subunit
MEVRPGYKQTEVGVIPEEWAVKPVGAIGDFKTGPFGTSLKANEYYANEGVPLVSVRDIGQGVLTFNEHTPLVPPSVVRRLPEYVLNGGDIVFGRKGSVERSALVAESQAGCFLGSDGIRMRPSKGCHAPFVAYQLQRSEIQAWMLQNATGTTMASLNQEILRRILLPFPPTLAEQRAIAEALSDADALIEALEQLLAKKHQIKHGAMQELLTGHKRLPGFSGEWEVKAIEEIADCLDTLRIPLNDSQRLKMRGDFPYCGANGILDYIDRYCIDDSVILMAEDGGYFDEYMTRPIAYRMSGKFWVNNHAHILKSKPGHDQDFLYYSLVHKNILSFIASGTRAKLNRSELNKITIRQPATKAEQTAIAAVLSEMDAEIAALEARVAKARQVKQGMMQELLTGRIRLVV